MDNAPDTYAQLISFLDTGGAQYRLIDHEPEGRTEVVSPRQPLQPTSRSARSSSATPQACAKQPTGRWGASP